MALHAVTVLHLSDLHERGPRETEPARRFRVLDELTRRVAEELDELQQAQGTVEDETSLGDDVDS